MKQTPYLNPKFKVLFRAGYILYVPIDFNNIENWLLCQYLKRHTLPKGFTRGL